MCCSCAGQTSAGPVNTTVYIPRLVDTALSWRAVPYAPSIAGMRLLSDGPRTRSITLAVTRAVLHTNARLSPVDALMLAEATVRAARANGLPPEFLAATLLQESAYDPGAISAAGAAGIAQFMFSTAQSIGVDPFDPIEAISGSAALLASYLDAYAADGDAFARALAAYNAGPGAVAFYRGVPPFAETREYIDDIVYRWAKISGYESPSRS